MSLFEALLALAVVAILTGAATVTSRRFADRIAVEAAQGNVLNAYRRAQSAARTWGRPAELSVATDSIVIRTIGIADTVVLWQAPGPGRTGVSLTPTAHVALFGANGLATGAGNVSHILQKGGTRRVVVVSRLGRVKTR